MVKQSVSEQGSASIPSAWEEVEHPPEVRIGSGLIDRLPAGATVLSDPWLKFK